MPNETLDFWKSHIQHLFKHLFNYLRKRISPQVALTQRLCVFSALPFSSSGSFGQRCLWGHSCQSLTRRFLLANGSLAIGAECTVGVVRVITGETGCTEGLVYVLDAEIISVPGWES